MKVLILVVVSLWMNLVSAIRSQPDLGESVARQIKQKWAEIEKKIMASHPLHFVHPDIQADVEAAERKWRQNHPKPT